MNFVYLFVYRNVMKACDDLGRNAVHLAAGHTGPTAQKLVDLLLNNCMEDELGLLDHALTVYIYIYIRHKTFLGF